MTVVYPVTAKVVTDRVRRLLRKRGLRLKAAHPLSDDPQKRFENCFRWNVIDTATGRVLLEKLNLEAFAWATGALPYWEICDEFPPSGPEC